jgi:hypothetical protein
MFLFWGWVVYVILEWRKLKHKNQLQNKIIDKLNSVPELNEFLQTEGGSLWDCHHSSIPIFQHSNCGAKRS